MSFFQSVKVGGSNYDIVPRKTVRGNPDHAECQSIQIARTTDPETRANPPEFVMGDVVETPRGRAVITTVHNGTPVGYFGPNKGRHYILPGRATQIAHVEGGSEADLVRKFNELAKTMWGGRSTRPASAIRGVFVRLPGALTLSVRREEFLRWVASQGIALEKDAEEEDWEYILIHADGGSPATYATLRYADGQFSRDRSIYRMLDGSGDATRAAMSVLAEDVQVALDEYKSRGDHSRRGLSENPGRTLNRAETDKAAQEFAAGLGRALSASQMQQVQTRNRRGRPDLARCPSRAFIDTDAVMEEAVQRAGLVGKIEASPDRTLERQRIYVAAARRYGLDGSSEAKRVLGNPHLILVTGNPPPSDVEIEKRWCQFHQKNEFRGRKIDLGPIRGAPKMAFAIGELVDISFGDQVARFNQERAWLVCDPSDDRLWIVSRSPMDVSAVTGSKVTRLTYDPPQSSGKDPAHYRHKLINPHPTLTPIGDPRRTRAVVLEGGSYKVRDWLYD